MLEKSNTTRDANCDWTPRVSDVSERFGCRICSIELKRIVINETWSRPFTRVADCSAALSSGYVLMSAVIDKMPNSHILTTARIQRPAQANPI